MPADEDALARLVRTSERLAELADTAELMDDPVGAEHLRLLASHCRDEVFDRLDRQAWTG